MIHSLKISAPALLLFLVFAAAPRASAQIVLSNDDVVVGEAVTVTLPAAADTLVVTYRPNSAIAQRHYVPTGGRSSIEWRPERAGIVALSAPGQGSRNVSVRFAKTPLSGLLVLLLAGTALFGGMSFAMVQIFKDRPAEPGA